MTSFEQLLQCSGEWDGNYQIQVTPEDPTFASASALFIAPLLRNTFVRIDQTWSWKNDPQSGSLLIGFDRPSQGASIHWIDTWHNGTRVMPLIGAFNTSGVLVANGHFAVENSPDWGWRIEISMAGERLKIDMFCVNPDGKTDEGWVRAEYRRQ